jgi:hypothetical protein
VGRAGRAEDVESVLDRGKPDVHDRLAADFAQLCDEAACLLDR